MPKSLIFLFCTLSFYSFSQVIGGRNNSEMTPTVSEPANISSGGFSGDVNLFSGAYSSSIPLGSVSTPGGLSYALSLNYNSSFSVGNTSPISKGIPYGDGWNLNIPTVSIESEVFNTFTNINYCQENTPGIATPLEYSNAGDKALNEGDLYWYSPYINIPGVASGRAIFKYIDENDNQAVVFELNAFETHVEIRFDSEGWTIITDDGTIYELSTAIQSFNAPANKRVLYYPPNATQSGNIAWDVVSSNAYNSSSTAGLVANSITPKQRYNLWYCNAIRHKNKPFQSIVFFYKGYGKFNYFKEFDQEAYKYAASTLFGSSTFSMEQDFSCYSDLLLTKIESYSIDGLVNRLELKYETEKSIIGANPAELIAFNQSDNGRLDSLYSYQQVFKDDLNDNTLHEWKRYKHTKSSSITNANNVNPHNPYLADNGYLRDTVSGNYPIPFDHSFLESPRILDESLIAGDIYEVRSSIARTNAQNLRYGNSTIDISVVTGTLGNLNNTNNAFNQFDHNVGNYYSDGAEAYKKTRGINLFSTFNMALKWTLSYTENSKQTSNLFVMPNFPTNFHGLNIQIGPGNSDMNYNAQPSDVSETDTSGFVKVHTDMAYYYRYPSSVNSAADINSNFGVGMPWAQMAPIYKKMVTALNAFTSTSDPLNTVFNMWWNLDNPSGTPYTHANCPTKMDSSVTLNELEVIRYSKNPYMLKYVEFYNVNGEVGGPTETGLHLIAKKKLEYTSAREKILENYDYEDADTLRYKPNLRQVFVLLSKVRDMPINGQTDTTLFPTTFFSYDTFKNNNVIYDQSEPTNPLAGHAGKVLSKITDNLGGITQIEYYQSTFVDNRTIYTSSTTFKQNCSGLSSPPPYGLSSAITVSPVVKTVLKNDEDDLVKTGASITNTAHKKWTYDFAPSSRVYKQTQINIHIPNFFNTRITSKDIGFKNVTVYGPTLTESGNNYVNKTVYEHYGYQDTSVSGNWTPSIQDYLYHGKLKSVKEYDSNNKMFTEKSITYDHTLAYKNGYERPNPVKHNLIWEQEYDNPGNNYEYRDYYLNQPLTYVYGGNTYVGQAAYKYLDVPVLNGSGGAMENAKSLEFYFYPQLKAHSSNPEYLFHSYFVKKMEEVNRKYDDYLYKQPIISSGTLPAPYVYTGANPFGSGHTNPRVYSAPLAGSQIAVINSASANNIVDTLIANTPIMDSVLYHVINTTRLSDQQKMKVMMAQGNLSNLTLNRFIAKFGSSLVSTSISPVSVINQQNYISDEVLITSAQYTNFRWSTDFVEALFLKNEYLSEQVIGALADGSSRYFSSNSFMKIMSIQPQFSETSINKIIHSRYLTPATLSTILKNQVITDANFSEIIGNSTILNNTIVEIIETGNKYPSVDIFYKLMERSPAFSESEMERIIAVANRDIEPDVLSSLIAIFGDKPFLVGFTFKGNPLDAYCNNTSQSSWNYIETKTTYEYYEADYRGTSKGRAYKVLMGLEDIPGRTVSSSDIFGTGGTKTVDSLRLKHEPS